MVGINPVHVMVLQELCDKVSFDLIVYYPHVHLFCEDLKYFFILRFRHTKSESFENIGNSKELSKKKADMICVLGRR
jgi:hypothetical protein